VATADTKRATSAKVSTRTIGKPNSQTPLLKRRLMAIPIATENIASPSTIRPLIFRGFFVSLHLHEADRGTRTNYWYKRQH
jgi:hypothetical protein